MQEQLAFGHEVTIRPEASLITDKKPYVVRLSDAAYSAVLDFASMALYFKQMIIAQDKYFEDQTISVAPEAPLSFQELFLEALNMGLSYTIVGGTIIYLEPDSEGNYPTLPAIPIDVITIEQAIVAGYTVPTEFNERQEIKPSTDPKTYEDNIRPVDPLDHFLVVYAKTIAGPAGTDGTDGADGQDGADGAPGDCADCQPPDGGGSGPPGGDGGGSGGPGTGGSGPDGSNGPNPDGGDTIVFIPGCPDPIIDFPFCSEAFSFANADLRAAIEAAVEGTGQFNSATDELISVVLEWHGAAYGGVASVEVPTPTEYLPPQSNTAKFLTVEDAANNKMVVPHTIEKFGIDDVLVVQGYHYDGSTGLRMIPAGNPILLNGQMSNYPLIGGANCHSPADETDPAWLKVCLRQFVKHSAVADCVPLPIEQLWTQENYPFQHGHISNQDGWADPSQNGGVTYAQTYEFDSKVYLETFHPPSDGDAADHLTFIATFGGTQDITLHLAPLDHYDDGVEMQFHLSGINGGTWDAYNQWTTAYEMFAGTCYVLEWRRTNGTGRVTLYKFGAQWS